MFKLFSALLSQPLVRADVELDEVLVEELDVLLVDDVVDEPEDQLDVPEELVIEELLQEPELSDARIESIVEVDGGSRRAR